MGKQRKRKPNTKPPSKFEIVRDIAVILASIANIILVIYTVLKG